MAKIGSDLDVTRLCLGGNVFGWSADRDTSFAVLDAYVAAGGNFVDTADSYMWRAPGNSGGESETIIGEWLAARGNRDDMVIATKVGSWPERQGLSRANITAAVEDSLRRLQTDRIDLYYAHRDDPATAQEETLDAFDSLVRAGKVRAIGASNFTAERLRSALEISDRDGLTRYVALQPHYNLLERADFETSLAPLLVEQDLACLPYFGLAKGFLTGKYRPNTTVPREHRSIWTSAVCGCWRCSTRSRPVTTCPWPPSRWPGWPTSPPWPLPLPAHAPPSSWSICSRCWSCASPTTSCGSCATSATDRR
jgi:aryl-alcohol dehydrogenase-like predicted oxidoreductase